MQQTRRQMLRAGWVAGAALGLPWLQLFADPPAARAATQPKLVAPTRFGLFFWASGVIPERWVPETTGAGFDFSPQLAPLERHRDRLSVLSNYRVVVPNVTTHIPGPAGLLTGRPLVAGPSGTGSSLARPQTSSSLQRRRDSPPSAPWRSPWTRTALE
jgi:hypothetical protein